MNKYNADFQNFTLTNRLLALALLSNPAVNRRQEIRCICLLSITTHFQFRNCKASRNKEQDRNDRNGQRVEPEIDENSISFQLKPTC